VRKRGLTVRKKGKVVLFFRAVGAILALMLVMCSVYLLIRGLDPFALLVESDRSVGAELPKIMEYKEANGLPLEIHFYEPVRKLFRRAPLIIYIHGGSWKHGSHVMGEDEMEVVGPFLEYGIAVASVQYRLTDEVNKFPDHINDVTDAIRFLYLNADELGVDRRRFCELGGSAGAHLALLAAHAQEVFGEEAALAGVEYKIKCVVALSTPCDFVDLSCYVGEDLTEVEELLEGFLGASFEVDPLIYEAASPVSYIDGGHRSIPVFMAHGERDTVVPIIQADNYFAAARQAGMRVEYVRVLNAKHGLGSFDGGPTVPEKGELLRRMVWFILRNVW